MHYMQLQCINYMQIFCVLLETQQQQTINSTTMISHETRKKKDQTKYTVFRLH